MKPYPTSRHAVAFGILLAVSVLAGVLAFHERLTSDDQVNSAVGVLRSAHPELYSRDPVFGPEGLWKFRAPLWQLYLRTAYESHGSDDIQWPFRVLAGPLLMLYLSGMYWLLWRQCRSWSVAVLVAVLSMVVLFVGADSYWGLGPLASMQADAVALAPVPLLAGLLMRPGRSRTLWVFLVVGLLANVHAPTGLSLALVFGLTVLGQGRLRAHSWLTVLLGALCVLGGASPVLAHYAALARWAPAGVEWTTVAAAFDRAGLDVLYPQLLGPAMEWLAHTAVLWLGVLVVFFRAERLRASNRRAWVWMLVGALLVGLWGQGIAQLIGMARGSRPVGIFWIDALKLAMLPLYVLFAQAMVHLLRLGADWLHTIVRVALAVLAVFWLVPSPNLRQPRHWVEYAFARAVEQEQRPENVQRWISREEKLAELRYIGYWLSQETSADARLLSDEPRMRLWARRALLATSADVKYYYYLAPDRLAEWTALLEQQRDLVAPPSGAPASAEALDAFAADHGVQYIVLPATSAIELPLESLAGPDVPLWGRYWVLYHASP